MATRLCAECDFLEAKHHWFKLGQNHRLPITDYHFGPASSLGEDDAEPGYDSAPPYRPLGRSYLTVRIV